MITFFRIVNDTLYGISREHLGFSKDMYEDNKYPESNYDDISNKYQVHELNHDHE